MTSAHIEMIQKYFYEREDDKRMKKSAALMVEAMTEELDSGVSHPNQKHYIPYVSEVTVVISQLSTKCKNN